VEPTYKPLSTSHTTLRLTLFTRSEDESVSRVLCVRVLAPTEGLGGAALVVRVLQEENKRKRYYGQVLWAFHPLIHITQLGETVLPNVFLKRLHSYR
jgi:hypothetical protein